MGPRKWVWQQRWMAPLALWALTMAVLLFAWRACRQPEGLAHLPAWFLWLAHRTGTVLYEDPLLAIRIQISRLMVIASGAAGLCIAILERERLVRAVRDLLNQERDPINLAIFRIVVFWQIYNICDFDFIAKIASLPVGLQYPPQTAIPRIWHLAPLALWPAHTISIATIVAAGKAMKWAAVAGAVGLYSRTSAALVSFFFLWAWARLQWYGKVDHLHHLLWFALLLAVSPCGDILSVDWLIARGWRNPVAPGRQYGMPLGFAMMLMGVIYLFPGLWKICRSGLDWALSDSPKLMMYQEWRLYGDWLPSFRFDQHPFLYHTGTLCVLLFELSFLFLLLGKRTRILAGFLGVGFHIMTYMILNIEFETLRNCYVVFVDWGRIRQWLRKRYAQPMKIPLSRPAPVMATAVAGTFLVAGNVWAGAMRAMDGWPLSCYPPFDGLSQPYYRTLRIQLTMKDGSQRVIVADEYRTVYRNRWNNLLQRILQERDEKQRLRKLALVWSVVSATDPTMGEVRHLRFYEVRSFVAPSHWHEEPDDPQTLWECDLPA